MFSDFSMLPVNLRLFDGEGGAEGGTQGETQQSAVPGNTRRGKTGEYDNVLFGKQPEESVSEPSDAGKDDKEGDVTVTSDTLEDRRKAFRDLVRGEYKDVYDEEMQRIVKRRLKDEKGLKDQLGQMQPIIDMLAQKYQIGDNDLSKLAQAIEDDDVYWSDAAEEAGMTVEQYKQFQRLQRENAQLIEQERVRQGREATNRQVQEWYQQAEETKKTYPSFDLAEEAQNPQFLSLLQANVPVRHAYEVIHMDDIKAAERQLTARATEQQVTANVRARGARPTENGTASQGGFTIKSDPSKWSKKDRAEVVRKVQRGEKVYL